MADQIELGDVWWHPKGYYKVGVTGVNEFAGNTYVSCVNLANAGFDYKDYQKQHFAAGMAGLKARWYEENTVRVFLEARFREEYVKDAPAVIHEKAFDFEQTEKTTVEFIPLDKLYQPLQSDRAARAGQILDGDTRSV